MILNKIKYILIAILKYFHKYCCPYCGNKTGTITDRKYFITRLIECNNCHLLYRHPTFSEKFYKKFYQKQYQQNDGITTELPTNEKLEVLKKTNFKGTERDASRDIDIMKLLFPDINGIKILDFGASWGYKSYQFKMAGMDVRSYEISLVRAKFGEKLGIQIHSSINELTSDNDIFYSSHVIEHIPDLLNFFEIAKKLLKPEGIMFTICPNGSDEFRVKYPYYFHKAWGLVHPVYINEQFLKYVLKDVPYFITSLPCNYSNLSKWNKTSQIIENMSGNELLAIAYINKKII